MKRRRVARRKITHRWMINNLSVIVAVLLVFEIMFMVAARGYFYQNVQYVLASRARVLTDSFLTYQSERISGFEDVAGNLWGILRKKKKWSFR